jgi:hypothetical protein
MGTNYQGEAELKTGWLIITPTTKYPNIVIPAEVPMNAGSSTGIQKMSLFIPRIF